MSLKLFLRFAFVSTVIKLLVPWVAIITLFVMVFHFNRVLSPAITFMPYGFDHVLMAIAGFGVLFSFLGFQASINLAEDSKRAKQDVAIIISYVTGPVSVMVLRKLSPEISRPIKFPALRFVAPLSFVFTGCLSYWASWPLSGEIIFVILSGIPAYIYYEYQHHDNVPKHLRAGLWMIA